MQKKVRKEYLILLVVVGLLAVFSFTGPGQRLKNIIILKLDDNALIGAINSGEKPRVKALIDAGADVNLLIPADRSTPLMHALNTKDILMVKLLLDSGADVNATFGQYNHTALSWATFGHTDDTVTFLIENGADLNPADIGVVSPLVFAGGAGRLSKVRLLLEAGVDVDHEWRRRGWTALMSASRFNHVDVMRALIEAGADRNVRYDDGKTALMVAAFNGSALAVSLLIEFDLDVNAVTEQGTTALDMAERKGYGEVVKILKEAGAKDSRD